jgi:hypothetical protein
MLTIASSRIADSSTILSFDHLFMRFFQQMACETFTKENVSDGHSLRTGFKFDLEFYVSGKQLRRSLSRLAQPFRISLLQILTILPLMQHVRTNSLFGLRCSPLCAIPVTH